MPSRVVFIDTLRPDSELMRLIEPHCVLIAGQWTKQDVCNELFGYASEDYYEWVKAGGKTTARLEEFLGAVLDWIDTLALEDGFAIDEVLKDVAHSYLDRASPRHANLSSQESTTVMNLWIRQLVQNAIASNQPLPTE